MIKFNLGCGMHPLKGFINLDATEDLSQKFSHFFIRQWKFQHLLTDYEDNCIDAVTASHSLMYLQIEEYPAVFKDIRRILKRNGVFRITEDNCERTETDLKKDSLPFGGFRSLTGPKMMREMLEDAHFVAYDVSPEETNFSDGSLIQQYHGKPPRVFHIEGVKN